MPAFATAKGGQLTAEQVKVLAEASSRAGDRSSPPRAERRRICSTRSQPDGARPESRRGHRRCSRGPVPPATATTARAKAANDGLAGAINDPDFLALISDQALRRYVITGRPDLGMPDYADPTGRPEGFKPLTVQDVTNVVALLAAWRRGGSADGKEN